MQLLFYWKNLFYIRKNLKHNSKLYRKEKGKLKKVAFLYYSTIEEVVNHNIQINNNTINLYKNIAKKPQ